MTNNTLGGTGLVVTQLGFGAMEIRGPKTWNGPDVTERQAEAILNAVLDAGINFIDTSYDYGDSEERIGKYIGSRRDEYFLATKCGCDPASRSGSGCCAATRRRSSFLGCPETPSAAWSASSCSCGRR